MIGFVYGIGSIAVCAGLVFVIRKFFPVSPEVSRKLLHFSLILVLVTWLYAYETWIAAVLSMAALVLVSYLILSWIDKHEVWSVLLSAPGPFVLGLTMLPNIDLEVYTV